MNQQGGKFLKNVLLGRLRDLERQRSPASDPGRARRDPPAGPFPRGSGPPLLSTANKPY